jgi:hypothetical protein
MLGELGKFRARSGTATGRKRCCAGGVGMRAAENDTPSNLGRVERRSRSLRLSRARSLWSRQP